MSESEASPDVTVSFFYCRVHESHSAVSGMIWGPGAPGNVSISFPDELFGGERWGVTGSGQVPYVAKWGVRREPCGVFRALLPLHASFTCLQGPWFLELVLLKMA